MFTITLKSKRNAEKKTANIVGINHEKIIHVNHRRLIKEVFCNKFLETF